MKNVADDKCKGGESSDYENVAKDPIVSLTVQRGVWVLANQKIVSGLVTNQKRVLCYLTSH